MKNSEFMSLNLLRRVVDLQQRSKIYQNKKREPYKKPKIITSEYISAGSVKKTRIHIFPNNKIFVSGSQITQNELNILRKLLLKRINVEKPFQFVAVGPNKIMAYEYSGTQLKYIFENVIKDPFRQKNIVEKAFDIIGQIHNENIVHGHCHASNFVYDKKTGLTLIDFKLAEEDVELDWNDPLAIYYFFKRDYISLKGLLRNLRIKPTVAQYQILLDRYTKMSQENKAKLLRYILGV